MNLLEIIGTLVGVIYLWLEYQASIYLWIAGIIMPAIYIFVYYDAGLYADCGINVYYLGAAVYGWLMWRYGAIFRQKILRRQADNPASDPVPISRTPQKQWLPLTAVFILTWLLIAWLLIRFTDSDVPWLDAFTTALSIVAMWMLARKYAEQWWAWVAVDAVSAGLYIYKDLYFTAALYALYTVIAVFGYFKWIKMMHQS